MGLRKGEILEVQVPASSSFKYKNVYLLNSENRNKWRIVAIYRNDNLILPTHMSEIEPYDRLLIVGQPNILKDVYKNIKKDVGMFPAPYGNNIYLLIDRAEMDRKEVSKLLKSAIYLQRKTKSKKLIIKIIKTWRIMLLMQLYLQEVRPFQSVLICQMEPKLNQWQELYWRSGGDAI